MFVLVVQMQTRLRTNMATIDTMLHDVLPTRRQYLSRHSLVLDILPYILEIVQPRLRQVNNEHCRHVIDVDPMIYLDEYCFIHQ
jgi:hypothetical protein